jgi:regulator of protease activity HflC (stomatin/prohibitin superfamily)
MEMQSHYQETHFRPFGAWPFVVGLPLVLVAAWTVFIRRVVATQGQFPPWLFVLACVLTAVVFVCAFGFFIVTPNHSRVLVLFGRYRGTVRAEGFYWTNPFTSKRSVSLRAHNVASEKIKVNDLIGNPIEIGAVIVWRVRDTAQATFDVEDHEKYVDVQVETAIREIAKKHPYDEGQAEDPISLRGDTSAVVEELKHELQERLQRAGIEVLEARISHLAYAPEIASAMLQRQQATAIIAARQKIVEGAVSIVEQALADLGKKQVVELDDERKATLVGNLLVVLCGQSAAQPVLNTGSLYT